MIDVRLYDYMKAELARTPLAFHRYMYNEIIWEDRMVGIVGPRGVGKSTMVKQYLISRQDIDRCLYVSADNIYFSDHSLITLADEFVKNNGRCLVVDEIHKYQGWSRELKQIYDTHSALQIIFTGSSVLDIHRGVADLSRRVLMFSMQGLSFREYLILFENIELPVYSMSEILEHKIKLPVEFHPLAYFKNYLRYGYYPFGMEKGFDIRLNQVIAQTLDVDIPQYADMNAATSRKLRRLLWLLSRSAPYKPNLSNLAEELKVSRNDLPNYLVYLEKAGMIGQLRDDTGGFRGLGKVEKIYLDNPNLMYVLGSEYDDIGNVRETFFYNQMRLNSELTSSKITDFRIDNILFEVGGKKKGIRQLEGDPNGVVVRDDIEYGHGQFVPLWSFGLTY